MTDRQPSFWVSLLELFRIAIPLMVSTGTFSLVLFTDRTMLLRFDGASMSASMAGGNLFWVLVCIPMGIVSMTGAIIGQHLGAGQPHKVGRLVWQSIWMSLLTIPVYFTVAVNSELPFQWSGQPSELVHLESKYLFWLMIGATGLILESALSGFFAGIERTGVIMWASVASGILNIGLDAVLIFGLGPVPSLGIAGAAIASTLSFWFKVGVYAWLITRAPVDTEFKIWGGFGFDRACFLNLLFFGFPAGLMSLTEAGAFTFIVLRIGHLGDLPLRATAMAINFNMIAFVPLIGIAIGASVLVGRHLLESGPRLAVQSTLAALAFAWTYSFVWLIVYLFFPDILMSLYTVGEENKSTIAATAMAVGLLQFVSLYLILDATQLIMAAALRGAGDTWFVLFAGMFASIFALAVGHLYEPHGETIDVDAGLTWWWWMITFWIWMLAIAMTARFVQGRWKQKRMV